MDIRESTGLKLLVGKDGHVVAAELADGTTLDVDLVIVGIGVTANDRLAEAAGIEAGNGLWSMPLPGRAIPMSLPWAIARSFRSGAARAA